MEIPLLAMILSAFGKILMSIASVIQKDSTNKMPRFGTIPILKSVKILFTTKTWVYAMFLALAGFFVWLLAFKFGAIIYIESMTAIGIITIVILSVKRLNEELHLIGTAGIVLIMVGSVILALNPVLYEDLVISGVRLILLFSIVYSIILFLLFVSLLISKNAHKGLIYAIASGFFLGSAAITGRLMALVSPYFFLLLGFNFLVANCLIQMMYQNGKASVNLPILTIINMTVPIIIAFWIIGEQIPPVLWTGFLIILIGSLLLTRVESAEGGI